MKSIKELNEKLLYEMEDEKVKGDKEKPKDEEEKKDKFSSLKSKEFRDSFQQYKGRISGSAEINVDYKELKTKLESKINGINWTIPNVKKVFEVITKMIGVQPEERK